MDSEVCQAGGWSLCLRNKGLGKSPLPARLGKLTEVMGAAKGG